MAKELPAWLDRHHTPSLALEKQLGIEGIGRRYVMPAGHTMQSLEREFFQRLKPEYSDLPASQRLSLAQDYADMLVRLNPELGHVRFDRDNALQVWHLLQGATSGFNPDDIDYFINSDSETRRAAVALHRIEQTLSRAFNIYASLKWNPSPATADLILNKMAGRGRNPSIQP